ncbi:hypothetical protein Q1695_005003 [Nippostrongylus brasiliensis]|nr:hypothetical protein Q1695_005003 [Nippostrongylus brasiliensis]
MDPEMISSALCACSQATTMQEMLAASVGNQQLCDQYRDERAEVISMALNEEQRCENSLAVRENQVNSTSILSEKVEQEKLELARNLRVRREMLMSKKDALQSILAERKMSVEELTERRNRMKPLASKRRRFQELSESCEVTQQNIAFYSQ